MNWLAVQLTLLAIASGLASPSEKTRFRSAKSLNLKNAASYNELLKELEEQEKTSKQEAQVKENWFSTGCRQLSGGRSKFLENECVRLFAKPAIAAVKIVQATMPSDARPTDAEIETLAKQLSTSVQNVPIEGAHHVLYNDESKITGRNIEHLKNVFCTSPITSGRQLLNILKHEDKYLYCSSDNMPTPDHPDDEMSRECTSYINLHEMFSPGTTTQVYEFFRNDENTLDVVRNFAMWNRAVNQRAGGIEAVLDATPKTDFWTAVSTVVREIKGCLEAVGSPEVMMVAKQASEEFVKIFRSTSIDDMQRATGGVIYYVLSIIPRSVGAAFAAKPESEIEFKKCLSPEEGQEIFKDIAGYDEATLSDEKLEMIKKKSSFAWAAAYLANRWVVAMRRKDFDGGMEAFYKKVYTFPQLLRDRYGVLPTPQAIERNDAIKATILSELNKLPLMERRGLVERFPVFMLETLIKLK